jgi:hypothetical protein
MQITLNSETERITQYIEILPSRIAELFNEAHRGIVISGSPKRIGAVHWFPDQILFGLGRAIDEEVEDDCIVFEELEATLILELRDELPAGRIDPSMDFDEILSKVAESFGLPVTTCAAGKPAKLHFENSFDGEFRIQGTGGDDVFFQGDGVLDEGRCWYVWAFSLAKYKNWFARQVLV